MAGLATRFARPRHAQAAVEHEIPGIAAVDAQSEVVSDLLHIAMTILANDPAGGHGAAQTGGPLAGMTLVAGLGEYLPGRLRVAAERTGHRRKQRFAFKRRQGAVVSVHRTRHADVGGLLAPLDSLFRFVDRPGLQQVQGRRVVAA